MSDNTTTLDRRTTDLTEFETGDELTAYYTPATNKGAETITGTVALRYGDDKVLIETRDGVQYIVNAAKRHDFDSGVRNFATGDGLGRFMFAEHPAADDDEDDESAETDADADESDFVTPDDVTLHRYNDGDHETYTRDEWTAQADGRRSRRLRRKFDRLANIALDGIESTYRHITIEELADRGDVGTVTVPHWATDDDWERRFGGRSTGPVLIEDYSDDAWKITAARESMGRWIPVEFYAPKSAAEVRIARLD